MLVVDYSEYAEILLTKLKTDYPNWVLVNLDGDSVNEIATLLQIEFDPEDLYELMDSELGQGMILGILAARYGSGPEEQEEEEAPG